MTEEEILERAMKVKDVKKSITALTSKIDRLATKLDTYVEDVFDNSKIYVRGNGQWHPYANGRIVESIRVEINEVENNIAVVYGNYKIVHFSAVVTEIYTDGTEKVVNTGYNLEWSNFDKTGVTFKNGTLEIIETAGTGVYSIPITVTATDGSISSTDTMTINVTVSPVPTLQGRTISITTADFISEKVEGTCITVGTNSVTTVSWNATNIPDGITFKDGTFTGRPTSRFNGTSTVTVTTNGGTDTADIVWNVAVAVPILNDRTITKNTADNVNEIVTGNYITVGENGVTSVEWSVTNVPAGLTFANGKFTGTPTEAFNNTSVVTVTTDGGSASANVVWSITVAESTQ